MLHVLRVGGPRRDVHERYAKWNSVYVRFRRWAEQGVWDALWETLVELGIADDRQHMIDSTPVQKVRDALLASSSQAERLWITMLLKT